MYVCMYKFCSFVSRVTRLSEFSPTGWLLTYIEYLDFSKIIEVAQTIVKNEYKLI
jgi:hypothetical protein